MNERQAIVASDSTALDEEQSLVLGQEVGLSRRRREIPLGDVCLPEGECVMWLFAAILKILLVTVLVIVPIGLGFEYARRRWLDRLRGI